MDIKQTLRWANEELKNNKVSEPEKSAEFLLRQVLISPPCHSRAGGNPDRKNKAWIMAHPDYELNEKQEKKFQEFIKRRKKHEPVWYITGKIEFYGLDLEVNQNVLIPRPETEFLVEEVIEKLQDTRNKVQTNSKFQISKILEIGTGSGAIILAITNKLKVKGENLKVNFFASDISKEALQVAKKNAEKLKLEKLIEFREGDLLEPWNGEKFDIIVANLPYIPHEDMSSLALDIHHWEPRVALDGGKDGLEIYEKLLGRVKDYLSPNAMMFFEIGIEQGEKLQKLVSKYLPSHNVKIKKDYGDIDRIAIISS